MRARGRISTILTRLLCAVAWCWTHVLSVFCVLSMTQDYFTCVAFIPGLLVDETIGDVSVVVSWNICEGLAGG